MAECLGSLTCPATNGRNQAIKTRGAVGILGLPEFPTNGGHFRQKRVLKSSLFNTRDEIVEVELKQVFEQTCRNGHTQVSVWRGAPTTTNDQTESGCASTNSPTAMMACHRGSVSASGAGMPGRTASAAAIASSTVMAPILAMTAHRRRGPVEHGDLRKVGTSSSLGLRPDVARGAQRANAISPSSTVISFPRIQQQLRYSDAWRHSGESGSSRSSGARGRA